MSRPFTLLTRVRYADCDAQGVMFNARYGDYVDLALTELYRVLFGGYQQLLARDMDFQVVRLLTEWQSPARFDDLIAISIQCNRVGNTSISFQLDFRQQPGGEPIATVEITNVMISASSHSKMPVSEAIRRALQDCAKGTLVDLSGNGRG